MVVLTVSEADNFGILLFVAIHFSDGCYWYSLVFAPDISEPFGVLCGYWYFWLLLNFCVTVRSKWPFIPVFEYSPKGQTFILIVPGCFVPLTLDLTDTVKKNEQLQAVEFFRPQAVGPFLSIKIPSNVFGCSSIWLTPGKLNNRLQIIQPAVILRNTKGSAYFEASSWLFSWLEARCVSWHYTRTVKWFVEK